MIFNIYPFAQGSLKYCQHKSLQHFSKNIFSQLSRLKRPPNRNIWLWNNPFSLDED